MNPRQQPGNPRRRLDRNEAKTPFALLVILLLSQGCSSRAPTLPDDGAERTIAASESHVYDLALAAGDYLELAVDQRGVDVAVTVFGPGGGELFRVDSPNGNRGPEPILFVADTEGLHRLEVTAGSRSGGRYAVLVEAKRLATAEDRRRAGAAAVFRRAEELRRAFSPEALDAYGEALGLWQEEDDAAWLAETWDRLGRVHARLGEWRLAADAHRRAASFFEARDDPRRQAAAWDRIGEAFQKLGQHERAVASLERALELWQQAADPRGEAVSWNNLGPIYQESGRLQRALEAYALALERFREIGLEEDEAVTLHNLGFLHAYLGRDQRALDLLGAAAEILGRNGTKKQLATTLNQIGWLLARRGDRQGALDNLERALALRIEAGDQVGQAYTLSNLGGLRLLDQPPSTEIAAGLFGRALTLFVEQQDLWGEAQARRGLGRVALAEGRPEEARAELRRALDVLSRIEALPDEADVRTRLAAAERGLGNLDAARSHLEEGLELYEGLRRSVVSQELRAAWSTKLEEHHGAYVDLLMELEARHPDRGHAASALEASERSRARSLLDLLEAARNRPLQDADPRLLAREKGIQEELNGLEKLDLRLFDEPIVGEEQRAAWQRRRRSLVEELNEVRGRLHAGAGGESHGEPLGVEEIRRRVLDPETVLLEVELAAERSFLWILGSDRLESRVLAPGQEIEDAARAAHRLLRVSHRRESAAATRTALCRLSRLVLGQVPLGGSEWPSGRRLLVVTEGALQYVPFAALPLPEPGCEHGEAEPLLTRHEIIHLPSASVLAALRRGGPRGTDTVAVFADPVFSLSDPRVPGTPAQDEAFPRLRRLDRSRREAETILSLAAPRERVLAAGFAASKAAAQGGGLAGRRYVHFATHGVLDPEQPELSSLELARVDEDGGPVDGTLYAHEIYNLALEAELVVLSACRTALGKEIRGEGLVGLPQSFLYAGARRVVVSLWDVDDRVTTELMELFYRALFAEGLSPSAALRRAQETLWCRERRQAPYFWAGFVLQGEWRPIGS